MASGRWCVGGARGGAEAAEQEALDDVYLTRSPIGTQIYRFRPAPHGPTFLGPYIAVHDFTFYFWLAVTVLGLASLAVIAGCRLLRHFRPSAGAAA